MGFRDESPISFPNSSALARYRRVVIAAAVLAYADAGTPCYGTLEKATQTTDAQGAVRSRNTDGTLVMVASGAITQYAKVFAAANGKVAATGGLQEGIALQAATADGDEIEVLPITHGGTSRLFVEVAASSPVSNTVTETAFDQSFTIPAGELKAGDVLRIRAQVIATATNSTDTLNIKLKIGSTIIVATGALDVANNDIAYIDATVVIRTAGASGTLVAFGADNIGTPGTATMKSFNLASTAVDTTADQAVTVSATWSVANAGNSCRLDGLTIERTAA